MSTADHPWCSRCGTVHNLTTLRIAYPPENTYKLRVFCVGCTKAIK